MTRQRYLRKKITFIETVHKAIIFKKEIKDFTVTERLIYKVWSKAVDELTGLMFPEKRWVG